MDTLIFLLRMDIFFRSVEQTTDVISYRQPNQFFWNQGDGSFAEVQLEEQHTVSRGTLFGDYDNDGDTDLLITQLNGKVTLLRNESENSQQLAPPQINWDPQQS